MSPAALWRGWSARFAALSRRERILAFAIILVGLYMLAQTYLIDPLLKSRARLSKTVAEQRAILSGARQEVRALASAGQAGSGSPEQRRLAEQENTLREIQAGLLAPEQVPRLLESLMERQGRLRWVALSVLPAVPIAQSLPEAGADQVKQALAEARGAAPAPGPDMGSGHTGLYRHPVELTLRGSYAELTEYLAALERLPRQLFWERVELNAGRHPDLELKIRLYTLGLERAWLQI